MKIAVYMNSLSQNYQRMFYRGVQKRAKELGVNTVCIQNDLTFLSKHIPADAAIFLTPSLSGIKDFIFEKSFSNQFNGIPLLCAGNAVPGISSIIVQSEEAMQDLMTHLLDVHGYTNLLYVGGTESHPDNILREGIFKKTIQKRKHAGVNIQYECIHTSFTEYTSMIALEESINISEALEGQDICARLFIALGENHFDLRERDDRLDVFFRRVFAENIVAVLAVLLDYVKGFVGFLVEFFKIGASLRN